MLTSSTVYVNVTLPAWSTLRIFQALVDTLRVLTVSAAPRILVSTVVRWVTLQRKTSPGENLYCKW